jgi:two-component system OmpR family sensor kinase
MSLRLRLLLTLVPLFILGLVVADFGTFTALQSFLVSRVDDQLRAGHPALARLLQGRGPGGGDPQFQSLPALTWAALVDSSGKVIAGPVTLLPSQSAPDPANHPKLPSTLPTPTTTQPALLTVAGAGAVGRYRVLVDNEQSSILVVAMPLDDVQSTLDRLLLLELGISGGVTVVLLGATFFIVRRGLRPLQRMGETARTIVASDMSRRRTRRHRAAAPPLRLRRVARAAHAADVDARVRRAAPPQP